MDRIVQGFMPGGRFMGSVLVARGGEILLSKGYGFANLEWQIPNGPSTKFRLGSVTKQFTAAAVLVLHDRKELSIHESIRKYLPETPATWDRITIFQLLNQTSGIGGSTVSADFPDCVPVHLRTSGTPEQLISLFYDRPLEFEPGSHWRYSNLGYVVLGQLLERISGMSYAEFMRANVFLPLGMHDSGCDSNIVVIPRRAAGYKLNRTGLLRNAGYIHMSIPFSAGALYSTTEDIWKWERGLFHGHLISPDSLRSMTTAYMKSYGFGLLIKARPAPGGKRRLICHPGAIEGFDNFVGYYPESDVAVIILGNVKSRTPKLFAEQLGALAHGDEVDAGAGKKYDS